MPVRIHLLARPGLAVLLVLTGAAGPAPANSAVVGAGPQASIKITAPGVGDAFGDVVAVDGDVVVVGAPYADVSVNGQGSAHVFYRDRGGPNNWGEVKRLLIAAGGVDDGFGEAVAVSGDVIVVGAPGTDVGGNGNQGSAYVFYRDQGGTDNWGQVKQLTVTVGAAGDSFGIAVAVSGATIVVGAYFDNVGSTTWQGSAYVFYRDQGGVDHWGLVRQLTAADGAAYDLFGSAVALNGDVAVVGAHLDDVGANADQGSAYVFARNQDGADNWGQVKPLRAADGAAADVFGFAVAVDGATIVVGAYQDDWGTTADRGSTYVFSRDRGGADNWGLVVQWGAGDGAADDWFGWAVAVSGDLIAVGAPGDDVGGNSDQGSVYFYPVEVQTLYLPVMLKNK